MEWVVVLLALVAALLGVTIWVLVKIFFSIDGDGPTPGIALNLHHMRMKFEPLHHNIADIKDGLGVIKGQLNQIEDHLKHHQDRHFEHRRRDYRDLHHDRAD